MEITIVHEGVRVFVKDKKSVTLPEALVLIAQALRGVGFYFDGELVVVDGE